VGYEGRHVETEAQCGARPAAERHDKDEVKRQLATVVTRTRSGKVPDQLKEMGLM
jgi:hypothetical protein